MSEFDQIYANDLTVLLALLESGNCMVYIKQHIQSSLRVGCMLKLFGNNDVSKWPIFMRVHMGLLNLITRSMFSVVPTISIAFLG